MDTSITAIKYPELRKKNYELSSTKLPDFSSFFLYLFGSKIVLLREIVGDKLQCKIYDTVMNCLSREQLHEMYRCVLKIWQKQIKQIV